MEEIDDIDILLREIAYEPPFLCLWYNLFVFAAVVSTACLPVPILDRAYQGDSVPYEQPPCASP